MLRILQKLMLCAALDSNLRSICCIADMTWSDARSSCHIDGLPDAVQCCHSLCVQHQSPGKSWQDMCITVADTQENQKCQNGNTQSFLQVKSKANTIVALFNQLSEVQRVYAYLQLAKRFLFQCENQVVMCILSPCHLLLPCVICF